MRLSTILLASIVNLVSAHPVHAQLLVQELDPADIMGPPITSTLSAQAADNVLISDVLNRDRSINIFSGFTRDLDTEDFALDSNKDNFTVLAPTNDAIKALPQKPWEDPADYSNDAFGANAYMGDEGRKRANKNLKRFVESHIVMQSPWRPGQKAKTANGNEMWLEEKDGKWIIRPADVEVARVTDRVKNGEVWVLDKCLYPDASHHDSKMDSR